jgi:hypothetical protein
MQSHGVQAEGALLSLVMKVMKHKTLHTGISAAPTAPYRKARAPKEARRSMPEAA